MNIEATPSLSLPQEFIAIILCGYGARMYPLTEESNLPKALLPIANKPMISHALEWVEKTSISNVLVVCYPEAKAKISSHVHEVFESNLSIQVVEAPASSGSAEAIRACKSHIK
ncbi:hypothetical protein HDU91_006718, partial [Kappamyces sp. JEL0680]